MKKLFFFAFAVLAFAACSDDKGEVPPPADQFEVISFEPSENMMAIDGRPVVLGEADVVGGVAGAKHQHVFWAKPYAADYGDPDGIMGLTFDAPLFTYDNNVWFGSYYCDCTGWGTGQSDTWGGFALSQNCNTTATKMDYKDQFSLYGKSGANSTKTFAVSYYNGMMGWGYNNPIIEFAAKPRKVDHLYMAVTTVVYAYYTYDLSAPKDRTMGYKITGSLEGEETGSVVVELVKNSVPVPDWVKVDLSSLGLVDKLSFTPEGFNPNKDFDPAYFCIDEIALVKEAK